MRPAASGTLLLCALLWLSAPHSGSAQGAETARELAESRLRMEELRAERERLQAELERARGGVRDASRELANVERQLSASRSVLAELDLQLETVDIQSEELARRLLELRERQVHSSAALEARLRDLYKLGPLHSIRVLLGADSFADLLTRYRYLRMIAAYDKSLVGQVSRAHAELASRSRTLDGNLAELARLRDAHLLEVSRLRELEADHRAALAAFRSHESGTLTRMAALERDELRMTELVGALEQRRVEGERRGPPAPAGSGGGPGQPAPPPAPTAPWGAAATLPWPVEGALSYRFGLERRADGTSLRRNGIGIRAPFGTPVRAVRDGTVALAGPFEGYGPSVVLNHGGGLYTLYLFLGEVGVLEGRPVLAGQVVGTVGTGGAAEGPLVEFQIRAPAAPGGSPLALDPLPLLLPPGGGGR